MMTTERHIILRVEAVPDASNVANLQQIDQTVAALQKKMAERFGALNRIVSQSAQTASQQAKRQATDLDKSLAKCYKSWIDQQKAAAKAADATVAYNQKVVAGQQAMAEGFLQTLSGVQTLAQGIVALGFLGEESTDRVLRRLVALFSLFSAIKGPIQTFLGLRKMWLEYTAVVEASALAHQHHAAAQALDAKAALSNAGAQAKAAQATAVGAGAAGVGAGAKGVGGVAGLMRFGPHVAIAAAATAVIAGIISVFSKDFRKGLYELIGLTDEEAELRDALNKKLERRLAHEEDMVSRVQLEYTLMQAEAWRRTPQQQMAASAAIVADPRNRSGLPAYEARGQHRSLQIEILEKEKEKLKEQQRILEEQARIQKQSFVERARQAQASLQATKAEYEQHKNIAQAIKNRYMGAKEYFGSLSKEDQAELIRIKRKADAGGRLSREEEDRLSAMNLSGAQAIVSRGRRRRADEGGFSGSFGGEDLAAMARQILLAAEAVHKVEVGIKVDGVVVKLDSDVPYLARNVVQAVDDQITPKLNDLQKQIEKLTKAQAEDRFGRGIYRKGIQQASTGGG